LFALFGRKRTKPLEIICYHCQQSVEKALKAYLCANNTEIPKTHDAGLLCMRCADLDIEFADYQETCEEMVVYATHTRYPIRIKIEECNASRVLKQASELYSFVYDKIITKHQQDIDG